jgi:hypothetical protein
MRTSKYVAVCFLLVGQSTLFAQIYEVVSLNSGKVLDVTGVSTQSGALIQQWDWLGGANQQWQFNPLGNGYNQVTNINSNEVLDVVGGSVNSGALVQQYDWLGYGNQQWQVVPIGNGYNAIYNFQSGKVLDVTAGSQSNGAQIQQYDWLGYANQQWQLIPVDSSGSGVAIAPPPPTPSDYAFTSTYSGLVFSPKSTNRMYFQCFAGNVPIAGCDIALTLDYAPQTNAHLHQANAQPFSTVSPSSGYTGNDGQFAFDVSTGYIGQVEYVLGQSSVYLQTSGFDFAVGYGDLVFGNINALWTRTGGSDTGANGNHGTTANNRFMTMPAYSGMYHATVAYLRDHPGQSKICVNDATLPMGGKFDINGGWQGLSVSHYEHDRGSAVDIATTTNQCNAIPSQTVDGNQFLDACIAAGAVPSASLVHTDYPHVHCNWQSETTYPHVGKVYH